MALKRTKLDSKKRLVVYAGRADVLFELTNSHMREIDSEAGIVAAMIYGATSRKAVVAKMRLNGHVIRRKEVQRVVNARPAPATFWGCDFGIRGGYTEWSFQKYKSGALRFGCMRFSKAESLIITEWARGLK